MQPGRRNPGTNRRNHAYAKRQDAIGVPRGTNVHEAAGRRRPASRRDFCAAQVGGAVLRPPRVRRGAALHGRQRRRADRRRPRGRRQERPRAQRQRRRRQQRAGKRRRRRRWARRSRRQPPHDRRPGGAHPDPDPGSDDHEHQHRHADPGPNQHEHQHRDPWSGRPGRRARRAGRRTSAPDTPAVQASGKGAQAVRKHHTKAGKKHRPAATTPARATTPRPAPATTTTTTTPRPAPATDRSGSRVLGGPPRAALLSGPTAQILWRCRSFLPITMRWISEVPSPISSSGASR